MMILRAVEEAITPLLQAAIDDNSDYPGDIPVISSDEEERKPPMPYVVLQFVKSEETITPGSGIFKVEGTIVFKSHTKETTTGQRQIVLDSINNFAYDSTAAKLSATENFHCHGWHPTTGEMTVDNESKSHVYQMTYWIYCMAMDNS